MLERIAQSPVSFPPWRFQQADDGEQDHVSTLVANGLGDTLPAWSCTAKPATFLSDTAVTITRSWLRTLQILEVGRRLGRARARCAGRRIRRCLASDDRPRLPHEPGASRVTPIDPPKGPVARG